MAIKSFSGYSIDFRTCSLNYLTESGSLKRVVMCYEYMFIFQVLDNSHAALLASLLCAEAEIAKFG